MADNEDEIREKLSEMYELAANASQEIVYALEMDDEGNLSISEHIGGNTLSYGVWKGQEIEIARIESFDPTDSVENLKEELGYSLTEEQKKAFETFCEEEDIEYPTTGDLWDFSEELYHSWEFDYISSFVGCYADDWAFESFEQALIEQEGDCIEESV